MLAEEEVDKLETADLEARAAGGRGAGGGAGLARRGGAAGLRGVREQSPGAPKSGGRRWLAQLPQQRLPAQVTHLSSVTDQARGAEAGNPHVVLPQVLHGVRSRVGQWTPLPGCPGPDQ
jgi:hypothetical protein